MIACNLMRTQHRFPKASAATWAPVSHVLMTDVMKHILPISLHCTDHVCCIFEIVFVPSMLCRIFCAKTMLKSASLLAMCCTLAGPLWPCHLQMTMKNSMGLPHLRSPVRVRWPSRARATKTPTPFLQVLSDIRKRTLGPS